MPGRQVLLAAGSVEAHPAVPGRERRCFPGCGGELGTSTAACAAGAVSCHPILGNTAACRESCAVPGQ